MTDNEKRAHDLAVASVNAMMVASCNGSHIEVTGMESNVFDVYGVYMKYYESMLKSFNRDFPGK